MIGQDGSPAGPAGGRSPLTAHWRFLVGIGLLAAGGLVTAAQASNGVRKVGIDFVARYAGGRVVAEGGSPYDDAAVLAEQRELGLDDSGLVLYDAPPVHGVFRFLSDVPLDPAAALWLIVSAVVLAVFGAYAARRGGPWLMVLAFPLVVTFGPARHALTLGQVDVVFIGVLVATALWAERHPADGREAFGVPFVLLKPQTMLLPMAALGVRALVAAPRRAVVSAGIGLVALVVFGLVTVPEGSWIDWIDQLGDRPSDRDDAPAVAVMILALVGLAVLVRGLGRARRRSTSLDVVAVASAANVLFAVTGSWNPQWFLAMGIPLGMLLVAIRTGGVEPTPFQRGLLVVVCGFALGDGLTPLVQIDGYARIVAPVVAVALLAGGLTVLGEIPARIAAALVGVNLVATSLPYGADWRPVAAVAVGVAVLHLVLANGTAAGPDTAPRVSTPEWPGLRGTANAVAAR